MSSANMSAGKDWAPSEEEVRVRAYEIYAGRGYEDGNEESNWLQAEEELRTEHESESTPAKSRSATVA